MTNCNKGRANVYYSRPLDKVVLAQLPHPASCPPVTEPFCYLSLLFANIMSKLLSKLTTASTASTLKIIATSAAIGCSPSTRSSEPASSHQFTPISMQSSPQPATWFASVSQDNIQCDDFPGRHSHRTRTLVSQERSGQT